MSLNRLREIKGAPLIGCFLTVLALMAAVLNVGSPCCVGFFLMAALAFSLIAIYGIVASGGMLTWWKQTSLSYKVVLYAMMSVLLCGGGFVLEVILVSRPKQTRLQELLLGLPLMLPFVVVPIGFVVLVLLHYVTLFRTVKETDIETEEGDKEVETRPSDSEEEAN
jgi:glucan phosphoethanolaminetransferase (alkaline phosphatase superfamily)